MAYRLERDETVPDTIRRVAREQIERGLTEIDGGQLDRNEAVHQVRKHCKKVRALLRLARDPLQRNGVYEFENAWFRDTARALSPLRDAATLPATLDTLLDSFGDQIDPSAFTAVREALARRGGAGPDTQAIEHGLTDARDRLGMALDRLPDWPIRKDGFATVAKGLKRTYRRARTALSVAYEDPTTDNFHEWRKRVKYHWYHLRLLTPVWPKVLGTRADAAHDLSNLLGADHDLAVLRQTLLDARGEIDDPNAIQTLLALLDRRQEHLRTAARPLGRRLFAEKPKVFLKRMEDYWDAWRAQKGAGEGRD